MGDDVHQWQTVQGRRKKGSQKKSDIATSISSHNEHPNDITIYFSTSFPDSFGALAMLRAFKYYGNVTEVVIPTKRDAGGRRFGFARFARVTDIRGFELELDNIIIGRDKISVNLARFQRVEGEKRFNRNQVRKEGMRSRRDEEQHDKVANERSLAGTLPFPCKEVPRSFAHVVKTGKLSRPNLGSNNDKEEGKENSKCVDGIRSKEDNRLVDGGILLGQEDGAGGTQHTSNTNLSITSGVVRNETQSAEVDCLQLSLVSEGGVEGHKTGGVYSDGPRNVYLKLTKAGAIGNQDAQGKDMTRIHPTPAKVRKHQHTIQHLNLKIPNQDLSLSSFRTNPAEDKASSCHSVSEFNGVTRNPPSQHRPSRKPASSLSSAGEILLVFFRGRRNTTHTILLILSSFKYMINIT
ncbi:unnamed protein product [Trifolium pratense]|uniref:Uncharacterized protein n=1 Tax=Trifolium pratense TaxID=57577 RepID=A0ACB0J2H3_TRIPR|nr:unnamed protein product [Trifolium pratense]